MNQFSSIAERFKRGFVSIFKQKKTTAVLSVMALLVLAVLFIPQLQLSLFKGDLSPLDLSNVVNEEVTIKHSLNDNKDTLTIQPLFNFDISELDEVEVEIESLVNDENEGTTKTFEKASDGDNPDFESAMEVALDVDEEDTLILVTVTTTKDSTDKKHYKILDRVNGGYEEFNSAGKFNLAYTDEEGDNNNKLHLLAIDNKYEELVELVSGGSGSLFIDSTIGGLSLPTMDYSSLANNTATITLVDGQTVDTNTLTFNQDNLATPTEEIFYSYDKDERELTLAALSTEDIKIGNFAVYFDKSYARTLSAENIDNGLLIINVSEEPSLISVAYITDEGEEAYLYLERTVDGNYREFKPENKFDLHYILYKEDGEYVNNFNVISIGHEKYLNLIKNKKTTTTEENLSGSLKEAMLDGESEVQVGITLITDQIYIITRKLKFSYHNSDEIYRIINLEKPEISMSNLKFTGGISIQIFNIDEVKKEQLQVYTSNNTGAEINIITEEDFNGYNDNFIAVWLKGQLILMANETLPVTVSIKYNNGKEGGQDTWLHLKKVGDSYEKFDPSELEPLTLTHLSSHLSNGKPATQYDIQLTKEANTNDIDLIESVDLVCLAPTAITSSLSNFNSLSVSNGFKLNKTGSIFASVTKSAFQTSCEDVTTLNNHLLVGLDVQYKLPSNAPASSSGYHLPSVITTAANYLKLYLSKSIIGDIKVNTNELVNNKVTLTIPQEAPDLSSISQVSPANSSPNRIVTPSKGNVNLSFANQIYPQYPNTGKVYILKGNPTANKDLLTKLKNGTATDAELNDKLVYYVADRGLTNSSGNFLGENLAGDNETIHAHWHTSFCFTRSTANGITYNYDTPCELGDYTVLALFETDKYEEGYTKEFDKTFEITLTEAPAGGGGAGGDDSGGDDSGGDDSGGDDSGGENNDSNTMYLHYDGTRAYPSLNTILSLSDDEDGQEIDFTVFTSEEKFCRYKTSVNNQAYDKDFTLINEDPKEKDTEHMFSLALQDHSQTKLHIECADTSKFKDPESKIYTFIVDSYIPKIVSPENEEENVSLQPTIEWEQANSDTSKVYQISITKDEEEKPFIKEYISAHKANTLGSYTYDFKNTMLEFDTSYTIEVYLKHKKSDKEENAIITYEPVEFKTSSTFVTGDIIGFELPATAALGSKVPVRVTPNTKISYLTIYMKKSPNNIQRLLAVVCDTKSANKLIADYCESKKVHKSSLEANKVITSAWDTESKNNVSYPPGQYTLELQALSQDGRKQVLSRDITLGLRASGDNDLKASRSCHEYFADMQPNTPLCNEISYLREQGIFLGQDTPYGKLADLGQPLLRSEYFAVAARLRGNMYGGFNAGFLSSFRDLTPQVINDPQNRWWLEAISSLQGIVRGHGDGTLRPTSALTQAELGKIAAEAVFPSFRNNDANTPWYVDTVQFYQSIGLPINPDAPASRADAVHILYAVIRASILGVQPMQYGAAGNMPGYGTPMPNTNYYNPSFATGNPNYYNPYGNY